MDMAEAERWLGEAAKAAGLEHAVRRIAEGLFIFDGGTWNVMIEVRGKPERRSFRVKRKVATWHTVGEWRSAARAVKEAYDAS